jgi:Zn-dependent protease
MLFSLLSSGDFRTALISILLTLPTILIALSFHEAAHGYVAYKMGDRTAYNLGRVTFNPIKHLDPIGALFMLVFGYGWAKPVPINTRNFDNPKKGMALTALAGPLTNLILGIIGVFFCTLTIFVANTPTVRGAMFENEMVYNLMQICYLFFYYFASINLLYTVFNMIPLPPFDGSRIATLFLPTRVYFKIMQYERYSLLIVLGISIVCSRVFNFSPFAWLADKLFDLISLPIYFLFNLIF